MDFSCYRSICSDLEEIQLCIDYIVECLQEIISDEGFIFETRLVLSELAFNSAIHGNGCESSKSIAILVCLNSNQLMIKVSDEGTGCTYDPSSYDPDAKSESGRGLFLVQDLTDEMNIQNNTITVVKSLSYS